ncbi:MAG TPA: glycine cleavage T C-terminal barrel domain-containing protein [Vicinamibacterales bacterium]|nr:glycine cleavage T C-terminal barrel domain-containing protein [Vicinamibacterales bacterium]
MGTAYQAARRHAASIDRSSRGRIVVSGRDRASYLQGLLTNDIAALAPGTGCYAAYLTAQGRMISDAWVYELGDVILLSLPDADAKSTVLAKLDQFIFSEDVQLGDVTDAFAQIAVVGPEAPRLVGELFGVAAPLVEHACVRGEIAGGAAIVTRITDAGEPGFDLYVERLRLPIVQDALSAAGVVALDAATADVLRVEAGIPLFHRDMDEETIPLEAGIEARAINRNKGCYVGQEVIIRVLDRGHGRVAEKLTGLTISGDAVPPASSAVTSGDRQVGRVTSAVRSQALNATIALAYLKRDVLEPGTRLSVGGADAVVTALPFAGHQ